MSAPGNPSSGSRPFGSPESGWRASGGPFVSRPRRRDSRRLIVVVLLVSVILAAAVAVYGFTRRTSTSDDAEFDTRPSERVPTSTLAGTDASTLASSLPPASSPVPVDSTLGVVDAPVSESASLFEDGRIAAVVDEIAFARGADPLRFLRMAVYPEYLFGEVQNPDVLENVDQYQWRNELGPPEPVRLRGNEDLESSLFSADEVNWSAISRLVAAAPEALNIGDGVVSHVIVQRPIPFSTEISIRVFVTGDRNSGFVDADADGVITSVDGD
jgi:hypothetical protein